MSRPRASGTRVFIWHPHVDSRRPLERDVLSDVRIALGLEPGLGLWRNSVGQVTEYRGDRPRVIRYGLCPGSADLVGIVSLATPDETRRFGRFFALEVKRPGEHMRPDQVRWANLVRELGGFVAEVDSGDAAIAALDRARRGESC